MRSDTEGGRRGERTRGRWRTVCGYQSPTAWPPPVVTGVAGSASVGCRACFFFPSRRRHTRYWRDWSSDVCSSDLAVLCLDVGDQRVVAIEVRRDERRLPLGEEG